MKILGIYDSHNCGAALIDNMEIVAAVEEERLSRTKVEFGMPRKAIKSVLEIAGLNWNDLDAIAIGGIYDPTPLVRWNYRAFQFERKITLKWWLQYRLWKIYYLMRSNGLFRQAERWLNRQIVYRQLAQFYPIDQKSISHIDHHLCHANVGYRTSGFDKALIFIIDGSGDGYSNSLFLGEEGKITFIAGSKETASLGKFYSNATLGLGFKKLTGEGKLMGLAAYGNPSVYYSHLEHVLTIEDIDNLVLRNNEDLLGNKWALKVKKDLGKFKREDIAAAVQKRFEDIVLTLVSHFVKKFGINKIVLVGGGAMNVKMNQRVREMDNIESTFIFPAMTDAGIASGAALEMCYQLMSANEQVPFLSRLENSYLGPVYSNKEIKEVLDRRGYSQRVRYIEDIEKIIADLIVDGYIVTRFSDRMEYGPRTLGNRSILTLATRDDIEETLNQRLGRDEFMPFAPSILEEYASQYLEKYTYSPFMVETFNIKPEYIGKFPPITHIDNTLRPQIVRRNVSPGYWEVIKRVGDKTGYYLVLNTSYNVHGEPIVCSPDDALNTFEYGATDYLALGNWLLKLESQDIKRVRQYKDEG